MSFEIEGKLIEKFDTVAVNEKFQKREFVLETEENAGGNIYTQNIKFQLIQAKCSEIDNSTVGDTIKVHFNLQGRRWEKDGKVNFFNSLNAWRIESVSNGSFTSQSVSPNEPYPNAESTGEDQIEDLPF
jgi:hypothetical protein